MKKVVVGLMLSIMAVLLAPACFLGQAHASMSIERGKQVFQSTWKVYYPNDYENAWYSTITDENFLDMGSYTIDEMALPDNRTKFRVTLHLDSEPRVFYWVYISEGIHGYSMKIDKATDSKWYRNVLNGWRSIKD